MSGGQCPKGVRDDNLEAQEVEDLDEHGNPIMIDSGEVTERIGIVDGAIAVIQEPVMVNKMRGLTTQELAELKEQRNRNLDSLVEFLNSDKSP